MSIDTGHWTITPKTARATVLFIVKDVHFAPVSDIVVAIKMPVSVAADKAGPAVTPAVTICYVYRADFSTDPTIIVIVVEVHADPAAFDRKGPDTGTFSARTVLVNRTYRSARPAIAGIGLEIPAGAATKCLAQCAARCLRCGCANGGKSCHKGCCDRCALPIPAGLVHRAFVPAPPAVVPVGLEVPARSFAVEKATRAGSEALPADTVLSLTAGIPALATVLLI